MSLATTAGAAHLFSPLVVRGVTLRNRIGVSPMCMYSAVDGHPGEWHLVHLGARAVGGAGLVVAEATAVEPRGRISPADTGLWSDAHVESWSRVTRFLRQHGAVPGVQIAHAGRKACTKVPWQRIPEAPFVPDREGGWEPVGVSPIAFDDHSRTPRELTTAEVQTLPRAFADAAWRAHRAGFQWLELHAAHGYLLHSFHSPISNRRTDAYGGDFDHRTRCTLDTVRAIRAVWPDSLPLAVRLSCTDWLDGGWTPDEAVELARRLKAAGADLIDCSSGGTSMAAKVPIGPGFQVPFAERVRREAGVLTAAVGMITEPTQADGIIRDGKADLVLLGREVLRDPYWPLHAAWALGQNRGVPMPEPYEYVVRRK